MASAKIVVANRANGRSPLNKRQLHSSTERLARKVL
jgi:hypothetical protein